MPLFSSFSFSLQQIWTDLRDLLVKFSQFGNLDQCGLIQTYCRHYVGNIYCILTFCVWCPSEKIMTGVSGHISAYVKVINVFHNVNSILNTVTNIHPKCGILLKVSNVFRNENLVIFTVINIHSIRKSTKNRNSETRWKVTENSKLKQVKRQKSSW